MKKVPLSQGHEEELFEKWSELRKAYDSPRPKWSIRKFDEALNTFMEHSAYDNLDELGQELDIPTYRLIKWSNGDSHPSEWEYMGMMSWFEEYFWTQMSFPYVPIDMAPTFIDEGE